jgi:hypothetical protein
MPIYKNSRYASSKVSFIQTAPTSYPKPIIFYNINEPTFTSFYEHPYIEGERLDQLANRYYRNSKMWWYIAEMNPHITDINNIAPGTIIRIRRV